MVSHLTISKLTKHHVKATYTSGKEHTPQKEHNLWRDSSSFGIAQFGLNSVQQQKKNTVKTSIEHCNTKKILERD
jgi:hypothetical protein